MIKQTSLPVRVDNDGVVSRIRLNRPEKRNIFNSDIVEALIDAVEKAHRESVQLIIFEGEGKSFSAGFDFTNLSDQTDACLAFRFLRVETLLQLVASSPVSTLALAHGPTFGAGADLFTACDERIVDPDTTFRFPGLKFDVVLGTRRLRDRIGIGPARSVLSEGRTLSAQEALSTGLATGISDRNEWSSDIDAAVERTRLLSHEGTASLNAALVVGETDVDFAELARSVAVPGLQSRIVKYVEGSRK